VIEGKGIVTAQQVRSPEVAFDLLRISERTGIEGHSLAAQARL
jgi:hypothetical protein